MNQPTEPTIAPPAGLTKREYFAAIALQGLLSNGGHRFSPVVIDCEYISESRFAEVAVWLADLLIEQLGGEDSQTQNFYQLIGQSLAEELEAIDNED